MEVLMGHPADAAQHDVSSTCSDETMTRGERGGERER